MRKSGSRGRVGAALRRERRSPIEFLVDLTFRHTILGTLTLAALGAALGAADLRSQHPTRDERIFWALAFGAACSLFGFAILYIKVVRRIHNDPRRPPDLSDITSGSAVVPPVEHRHGPR